jgi:hypothetical protein
MLAKAPADRYESAHELLRTLRELCAKYHVDGPAIEALAALDEGTPLAGSRRTTSRLAEAMRTSTLTAQRRRRTGWIAAAAMILAAVVGGLLAWFSREPFLLAQATTDVVPTKMNSPYDQLMLARFQTTNKEAWLASVQEYFPSDTEYVPLAQQELAMYYLQHDQLDKALTVLWQLETAEQPRYRAFALGGEFAVRTLQQDYAAAGAVLPEFWQVREALDDDEMRRLVGYSYRRLQSNASAQTSTTWDTWFDNLQREDAPLAGDGPPPPRPGPGRPGQSPFGPPTSPRGSGPPRG